MSPEQAQGQPVGDRSDIFSFGAVLYEMIAGRRPFIGDTVARLLTETPPPVGSARKDVPPALDALITACLDKTPARRPSARDVADRLKAIRARLTSARPDMRALFQRPAFVTPLIALAVVGLALGWWWWSANARVRWARTVGIPQIRQLSERDDIYGAYMAESGGGRPRYFRITPAGRRACAAEARRLAGLVAVARQKKLLKA